MIVQWCAQEHVRGIAAAAVVAAVTDKQAIWNLAHPKSIGGPVRAHLCSERADSPVAVSEYRCGPIPTFIRAFEVDVALQPSMKGRRVGHDLHHNTVGAK
jgi:hypothetical protein